MTAFGSISAQNSDLPAFKVTNVIQDEKVVRIEALDNPVLGGTGSWNIVCDNPDGSSVQKMVVNLMTIDYSDDFSTVYRREAEEAISTYTSCVFDVLCVFTNMISIIKLKGGKNVNRR